MTPMGIDGKPSLPGIDWSRGLRYAAGNQALYIRFLKRFPEDRNMENLTLALSCGDMESAFVCAHTLKGLSMQLGIETLSSPASALCELLRPRNAAVLPQALALCAQLQALHAQVVCAIQQL